MTGTRLHTLTRKRLADMARQRNVAGWHEMRKDQLIDALLADEPVEPPAPVTTNGWADNLSASTKQSQLEGTAHEDRLTASAVSPEWMRVEWTIAETSLSRVHSALGQHRRGAVPVLRLYEIADDECQTHGRTRVGDTEVDLGTHEWFVRVDEPGRVYRVQVGMRAHDGEFYGICCSNPVQMPAPEHRAVVHASEADGRDFRSQFSFTNGDTSGDDVPFALDAEVTLRGVAHPHAFITVDGEHVPQLPDGTFNWKFALADGRHVLPAVCKSADGRREQTIVIALERNTKRLARQDRSDD